MNWILPSMSSRTMRLNALERPAYILARRLCFGEGAFPSIQKDGQVVDRHRSRGRKYNVLVGLRPRPDGGCSRPNRSPCCGRQLFMMTREVRSKLGPEKAYVTFFAQNNVKLGLVLKDPIKDVHRLKKEKEKRMLREKRDRQVERREIGRTRDKTAKRKDKAEQRREIGA